MAVLIPETLTRLQAKAFVTDAELSAIDRSRVIRLAAEQMAEKALRKLLEDCVKSDGSYLGFAGQTLSLDVYVLSPEELHKTILAATEQGMKDALHWRNR